MTAMRTKEALNVMDSAQNSAVSAQNAQYRFRKCLDNSACNPSSGPTLIVPGSCGSIAQTQGSQPVRGVTTTKSAERPA